MIKTFKCAICGEEVTGRKSYLLNTFKESVNGEKIFDRACKTHEQAQKAFTERKENMVTEKSRSVQRREAVQKGRKFPFFDRGLENLRNPRAFCWHCDKEGMDHRDFALRVLMNAKKSQIITGKTPNYFDGSDQMFMLLREEMGNKVVLKMFPCDLPEWKIKQLVPNEDMRQVAMFGKVVVLCAECAQKYEFDWGYDMKNFKPTLQDMFTLGAIMDPFLNQMADEELERETKPDKCNCDWYGTGEGSENCPVHGKDCRIYKSE